jgi:hypothetical protein
MKQQRRVVYVGPDDLFQGIEGALVERHDPATQEHRLQFQPESAGIMPIACAPGDVREIEPGS